MKYMLCQFDFGYTGQFYQELDNSSGNLIITRLVDLDGNNLNLPDSVSDPNYIVYGYHIIDDNPPTPKWAQ